MASPKIQPRTLKGFRDFLPDLAIAREGLLATVRGVYRSYGFVPIETPVLEYLEILNGKGGEESDKQMYRFQDGGGREVGMRFDLTVPFARFCAQHIGQLGTPFKRYHIAPVWRAENTQRGRYREFMQCDFDTIGTGSLNSDVETLLVIHDLFLALGFEAFQIRINNRKILNGLLERLGLGERATEILRAIDKLDKIGPQKVARELEQGAGTSAEEAAAVLELTGLEGKAEQILSRVAPLVAGSELGRQGLEELREVLSAARAAGVPEDRVRLDLSIARGLAYYTGTIFETFLDELPSIGSVCSGGRYDDLAQIYTKQALPGVGASLGIDRLLAALGELGRIAERMATASVFVALFSAEHTERYFELCARLRGEGLEVELYPEAKKLGAQLKYADRRGFPVAVIVGEDEWAEELAQIKILASGELRTVALADLGGVLRALLG